MTSKHKPSQVLPLVLSRGNSHLLECCRETGSVVFTERLHFRCQRTLPKGFFSPPRIILIILNFLLDVDVRIHLPAPREATPSWLSSLLSGELLEGWTTSNPCFFPQGHAWRAVGVLPCMNKQLEGSQGRLPGQPCSGRTEGWGWAD